MQDAIGQTIQQAEAKLAELKASPQGQKLAEWDERAGQAIAWVQAAAWVFAACIAAAAAGLVMAFADGGLWLAAAGIGGAIVVLMTWRAWCAIRRPQAVSEMVIGQANAQLGPARMVLGLAQRLRGGR